MANKQYPSDKQDKFMLRLPDGMRESIKKEAEQNGRSMNAEIVRRLEESLRQAKPTPYMGMFSRTAIDSDDIPQPVGKNDTDKSEDIDKLIRERVDAIIPELKKELLASLADEKEKE